MRHLRDLVTLLALCLFVGVSVAATVQSVRTGLPVAAVDRHDELRRKLTAGQLTELPATQQVQLLRQLEIELRRGVDWEPEYDRLSRRKRNLLAENLVDLGELWLDEKMDEYASLPNHAERGQFLDSEIRRLKNFQSIQNGAFAAVQNEPGSLTQAVAKIASRRFEQAGMLRKAELMGFANAARERWATEGLHDLLPPSSQRVD